MMGIGFFGAHIPDIDISNSGYARGSHDWYRHRIRSQVGRQMAVENYLHRSRI